MTKQPLRGFRPERLRALRVERQLSQGELALGAAVSTAVVSSWEVGRSTPQVDKLRAVVQVLDKVGREEGLPSVGMSDLIVVPIEDRTLRTLRELAGKTQPQLAAAIGVSTGLLAALERGHASLSANAADALCVELGVDRSVLERAYEVGRTR